MASSANFNTWYGYDSDVSSIPELIPALVSRKANGSNEYQFPKTVNLGKNLPPSHVKLVLEITRDQSKAIFGERWPDEISMILKKETHDFLWGHSSFGHVIDDFLYELDRKTNISKYTAVYEDGSPITVAKDVLNRWLDYIKLPLDEKRKELAAVPEDLKQTHQINPNILVDEPDIVQYSLPFPVSELEAEWIVKCMFITAAYANQWLRPYAKRISWRVLREDDIATCATLGLPVWTTADEIVYENYISSLDMPELNPDRTRSGILLSDGKWYVLPEYVPRDEDAIIPVSNEDVTFEGKKYLVAEILENPHAEKSLLNLARVADEMVQGLLPFSKPYPVSMLRDGSDRIKIGKIEGSFVISVEPDGHILGVTDSSAEKIEEIYQRHWNLGAFLTNGGHARYIDSHSSIPSSHILQFQPPEINGDIY